MEALIHIPSPLIIATLLDHALLTLIVRLLATPAMLPQSDDPKPAGGFPSIFSSMSVSSMLVLEDVGERRKPSEPAEEDAESDGGSSFLRYAR